MTEKLSEEEIFEKMRSKIKTEGYDYYKIIGVSKDAEMSEIKKKYRHLLAKYHPDKIKLLPESKRKIKQEQYPLIRMAGEVLTNPEKKKFYDLEQKTLKSSDISNQKSSFEDFIKLQESGITEDSKKRSELEFKKDNDKINKIRGFNPDPEVKLSKQDMTKQMQELLAQRDVESIELAQRNMFGDRSFNPNEFNNIFEKNKRKEDKKLKKRQELGDMVVYEDKFTAFNDTGLGNFISVDQDYGDIYNDEYEYKDDYTNYKNNKLTDNELKKKLSERDLDTQKYDKLSFNEYKSVLEDPFSISKDFGTIIGKDISNTGKAKQITSDMAKIYSKMIEYESSNDDDDDD